MSDASTSGLDIRAVMPFAATIGVEPMSIAADEVRARLPWSEARCTSGGVLHGGAIMSLADTTGGPKLLAPAFSVA